jgi:hypothetical protein
VTAEAAATVTKKREVQETGPRFLVRAYRDAEEESSDALPAVDVDP